MSALVEIAGSGSRFSVNASSFESGEKAKPPPPSSENGGTSCGSFGIEVADRAGVERNDEEMRALVAGEVVPVAVEQVSEDLRLYLAGRRGRIAILVALVAGGLIGRRDRRAIGIHRRREYDRLAVGRPLARCRLRLRWRSASSRLLVAPVAGSKSASQICCEPSRLDVNRMRLPSGANSGPPSPGWATAIFMRLAAFDLLQPQLRCFGVLVEIDGGHGVGQPLAVGRNGGLAQPLHLHHVFEGHGPFGLAKAMAEPIRRAPEGAKKRKNACAWISPYARSQVSKSRPGAPTINFCAKGKFTPVGGVRVQVSGFEIEG